MGSETSCLFIIWITIWTRLSSISLALMIKLKDLGRFIEKWYKDTRYSHYCFIPSVILHTDFTYFLIPWNVLLAMSMIPPVGLATAPTKPFPTPLKKPAAPSFWAPKRIKRSKFLEKKKQTQKTQNFFLLRSCICFYLICNYIVFSTKSSCEHLN